LPQRGNFILLKLLHFFKIITTIKVIILRDLNE